MTRPLTEEQRSKIANAVTTYDIKQSTKRGYNRYALSQYLAGLDNITEDMSEGYSLRDAVRGAYLGRLCDAVLKSLGLDRMTDDECKYGRTN